MNYLLEFYKFEEFSEIKEIINDVFLSEFDSINVVDVQKTFIDSALQFKSIKSCDFQFECYLITMDSKINKTDFITISERLEKIISFEFDKNIKFLQTEFFPINRFCLLEESDFNKLNSIFEFEDNIEDTIYHISDNEYSPVIDITYDFGLQIYNRFQKITIWIRKFNRKLGLSLILKKISVNENEVNYEIVSEPVFNLNSTLIDRHLVEINMDKIHPTVRLWIVKNLPTHYSTIDKLKEFNEKINNLNLRFNLDINSDGENESERLISMIKDKVFPIFSNDLTINLSKLYKEFRKLEEYNIDATWSNQGNYFFIFDINYKNKFYLLNVTFNMKSKNTVNIEFKDLDINDEVPIEDFSETIYLYLEEN
jgi:hypothetical protein